MALDKKSAGGRVRFVLLEAMGRAKVQADVDARVVDEVIAAATA
jgi:3-dehydroquinate synthetase